MSGFITIELARRTKTLGIYEILDFLIGNWQKDNLTTPMAHQHRPWLRVLPLPEDPLPLGRLLWYWGRSGRQTRCWNG